MPVCNVMQATTTSLGTSDDFLVALHQAITTYQRALALCSSPAAIIG